MSGQLSRLNAALRDRYRLELAALIGAERFLAEIKTTANLQHPHILPLFDSGTVDGPASTSANREVTRMAAPSIWDCSA